MSARYLVDKSAYARMYIPAVANVLAPLITAGDVAICGIVTLEILYSARNARDLIGIRDDLARGLVATPTQERDFERAAEVMAALAERGQHRAAKIPDLLLAAVAERNSLTILHYDEDFDRIADITGQETEWVVRRGSILSQSSY